MYQRNIKQCINTTWEVNERAVIWVTPRGGFPKSQLCCFPQRQVEGRWGLWALSLTGTEAGQRVGGEGRKARTWLQALISKCIFAASSFSRCLWQRRLSWRPSTMSPALTGVDFSLVTMCQAPALHRWTRQTQFGPHRAYNWAQE